MTSVRQERLRMPAGERRELIARAAGRLFAERGYAGTRLDDVAAAAQVTKPIVYRHFESKKALYLALLTKHENDLPGFFDGFDDLSEPDELARAILEGWLDYVHENQHAWPMLFRDGSGDEEIQAVRRRVSLRAREVLASFIAQRSRNGIPEDQIYPTAELLVSGLAGLALWWIDHPEVPKPVLVETAVRMSEPALGRSASAGGGEQGGQLA
jgi:AcrR family transcriptional regulator